MSGGELWSCSDKKMRDDNERMRDDSDDGDDGNAGDEGQRREKSNSEAVVLIEKLIVSWALSALCTCFAQGIHCPCRGGSIESCPPGRFQ